MTFSPCLRKPLLISAGLLLGLLAATFPIQAQETPRETDSVTLQWQEFRTLMNLDQDRIQFSWEEYQKLLMQTAPDFQPQYAQDGGNVILTRQEFQALLEKMVPPPTALSKPPRDYLLLSSDYEGRTNATSTRFLAKFELNLFPNPNKKAYFKIPLFQAALGLENVRLDGKPAAILSENGWQYLYTNEPGLHVLQAIFSVATNFKSGDALDLPIPESPITHVVLHLPKPGLEAHIPTAQRISSESSGSETLVSANCVPSQRLQISWRDKNAEQPRGPAKIYVELFNLMSIEADAIRVTTQVRLNVLQNTLSALELAVPEGYQILEVTGQGQRPWQVEDSNHRQILTIPFEYPLKGQSSLTIQSEKLLPQETMVADFQGFEVLDAQRESGFVAGVVKSDAEARVRESQGGEPVDFQKIPQELSSLSSLPILFAFKYIHHPFQVTVDITKHEREEALGAVMDLAQGATLLLPDGKQTHQFTFTLRNLWKQFIKLKLPDGSRIWSVYVDGKREKASQDKEGRILIPLARSQKINGQLAPFTVELIYTEPARPFSLLGRKTEHFPQVDVLINHAVWNFYLPDTYAYPWFQGDLKRADLPVMQPQPAPRRAMHFWPMIGGAARPESQACAPVQCDEDYAEEKDKISEAQNLDRREVLRAKKSAAANEGAAASGEEVDMKAPQSEPAPEPEGKPEVQSEYGADQSQVLGSAGLLSVHVNIPFSGQQVRFTKNIINQNEELALKMFYWHESISWFLYSLLLLACLYLAYRFRAQSLKAIRILAPMVRKWPPKLKILLSPIGLPVTLLAILILCLANGIGDYHPWILVVLSLGLVYALARLFARPIKWLLRLLIKPYTIASLLFLFMLFLFGLRHFLMHQGISVHWRIWIPLAGLFFLASVTWSVIAFIRARKARKQAISKPIKRVPAKVKI